MKRVVDLQLRLEHLASSTLQDEPLSHLQEAKQCSILYWGIRLLLQIFNLFAETGKKFAAQSVLLCDALNVAEGASKNEQSAKKKFHPDNRVQIRMDLPEGMLQLGICRMLFFWLCLLWLGIFFRFSFFQLFDNFGCQCGWAFSDSLVWLTFQEKWKCLEEIHPAALLRFAPLVWFLVRFVKVALWKLYIQPKSIKWRSEDWLLKKRKGLHGHSLLRFHCVVFFLWQNVKSFTSASENVWLLLCQQNKLPIQNAAFCFVKFFPQTSMPNALTAKIDTRKQSKITNTGKRQFGVTSLRDCIKQERWRTRTVSPVKIISDLFILTESCSAKYVVTDNEKEKDFVVVPAWLQAVDNTLAHLENSWVQALHPERKMVLPSHCSFFDYYDFTACLQDLHSD